LALPAPRSLALCPSIPLRRSPDLPPPDPEPADRIRQAAAAAAAVVGDAGSAIADAGSALVDAARGVPLPSRTFVGRAVGRFSTLDRKSTRLNSSHAKISYAVVCIT